MSGTLSVFTPGDLVVSLSGEGNGSTTYTDNQATPITLDELTTAGTLVGSLVLPQTSSVVNGVTESAISGEYGSSSEGSLELSADGHSLVIAGYGVNAATYNTGGASVYGNAALAQSTSIQGGSYTAVTRVIADINGNGTVDTSTALYNVFNTNNPRSVATVDGTSFYVSGQGVKGDTTQGLFLAQDGASHATAIDTADDTRTVEIYNGQLYVSQDSKQPSSGGTSNVSTVGTGLPTGASTETPLPGISQHVLLANGDGNAVNNSTGTVNLSPENYFFANATTLYIADGGNPKQLGNGDGGLQKWSLVGSTWQLDYTLTAGLNLQSNSIADPGAGGQGTTGLIGLTGTVVGNTVQLYATNATIGDLNQTYVFGIADALGDTTAAQAFGETFSTLFTAPADTNVRGIAFAPTPSLACYCRGTLIRTARGDVAVEDLAIGDEVVTLGGSAKPVRWLGQRCYDGRFISGQRHMLPVRIRAGALGDGLPRRDLHVSPEHAMFLDGLLIPAGALVNGVSITQPSRVEAVHYFHVELETHEVILAEGAWSESYVEDDNRGVFHNAHEHAALYPLHHGVEPTYCAPRHDHGEALEAVRRRLDRHVGVDATPRAAAA